MVRRKTAGEQSLKALSDNSHYDPLEVGEALCKDVIAQAFICARTHEKIFDEPEFFVCLFIAGDPLLHNLKRHKYAAFLYLPSPRPEQVCFLYNKTTQKLKRLWSLPNAKVMACISEAGYVNSKWRNTKVWCDAFYAGQFWETIRSQNNFNHLSEIEYIRLHREELIKSGAKDVDPSLTDAFDFDKIAIKQIVDTQIAPSD